MGDIHEQLLKLEAVHGVEFDYEAILLAARIARHPNNQTAGGESERFFHLLNKACERRYNAHNDNTKQLNKHTYFLRRAWVEYKELVKEEGMAVYGGEYSWLWRLEKELKDYFIDLVRFMKSRMHVMHDYFVTGIHEAERVKDYSLILNQLDSKIHGNFKRNPNIIGVPELAISASELTGIPASWIVIRKSEERYMRLKERLRKRVLRQDNAIESIINILLKPKACSSRSGRPLGSFLFVGPSGVVKSELAKAIANELYDEESRLIRIDMEEYMEPDSISCLVGTFTETLKNKPYSVVLINKIDKAHSSVIDTLVSVLSSDAESRKDIDLRNAMIIMTCDIEDEDMYELMLASALGQQYEEATAFVDPQVIQLLDKMILMNWPCFQKDITRLQLREWACARTNERDRGIIVCPSDSALTEIASNAAKEYGETGEGLRRWVDERVLPLLSKMLLEDEGILENIGIFIDRESTGKLSFRLESICSSVAVD